MTPNEKGATRFFALLLFAAVSVSAQQSGGAGRGQLPAWKNLKILAPDTDMTFVMQNFNNALGVQCAFCHTGTDYASDANPNKETARRMIAMGRQIAANFPSSMGEFPSGYHEVDCSTCHRGKEIPETRAPVEFWNHGESLNPNAGLRRAIEPGTNLKVLPADARVSGNPSLMHDFRDALHVDCPYCHSGGPNAYPTDNNPRKDTARKMILMLREINANFPGTGIYPTAGNSAVTCYTCHRGSPHPETVSNVGYGPPPPKR